jgi:O-antigen/teichoic acid export membrane protein
VTDAEPQRAPRIGRQAVMRGASWSLAAEALSVPSGLVTVAFLTRALGPSGYGRYALAASLIVFLEGIVTTFSSRFSVKCAGSGGRSDDVLGALLRIHLALGTALALLVWIAAGVIGRALSDTWLAADVRLFSLDLPLAALVDAHLYALIGLGRFRVRAAARAIRWIVRPALMVALVALGFGVRGALAGCVVTSLCELACARMAMRRSPLVREPASQKVLDETMAPLFISTTILALQRRVDLFALGYLAIGAVGVGQFAAAQNVALAPSLAAGAIMPVLLSAVVGAMNDGARDRVRRSGRDVLRFGLLLAPFGALVAGAAGEIARVLYGGEFGDSGAILALLMMASVGMVLASIHVGLLVALNRSKQTLLLAVPALVAALASYPFFVPRYGALGAAEGTLVGSLVGALAGIALVSRIDLIAWPWPTAVRAGLVAAGVFLAASAWPATGLLLPMKLACLGACIPAGMVALGELDDDERHGLQSWLPTRRLSAERAA